MKTKVFETRKGVALFFDEENCVFSSDNMPAVKAALKEDISNYKVDPLSASLAQNLMTTMENVDALRCKFVS